VALLLGCLLLAGSALSLASCRRGGVAEPPGGEGDLAPSIVTAGAGREAAIALGPFANLRTMGWLTASEAYGWGDVTDARQIYVTLGVGGDTRSAAIPVADQLAVAFPLPGGAGCAGVHYSDFTAWVHPMTGSPISLGEANSMALSPTGARLLTFGRKGATCFDTKTWAGTVQTQIPQYEFPYSGCAVSWITDSLIVVRADGGDQVSGNLTMVAQPGGQVLATISGGGAILSPYPSSGGEWLAVLAIDPAKALTMPEAPYPLDAGRELRVYRVPDPQPVAVISLSDPAAGKSITGLAWSPDGGSLAYAEVSVDSMPEPGRPSYGRTSVVFVARGPAFAPTALALGAEGPWLPARFSPAGDHLFLEDPVADKAMVWDFASGGATPVAAKMSILAWLGEELALGSSRENDTAGRPLLVEAASGTATDPGWPGGEWVASPDGKRIAIRVTVGAGEDLRPFGKVAAGDWLVVRPVDRPR